MLAAAGPATPPTADSNGDSCGKATSTAPGERLGARSVPISLVRRATAANMVIMAPTTADLKDDGQRQAQDADEDRQRLALLGRGDLALELNRQARIGRRLCARCRTIAHRQPGTPPPAPVVEGLKRRRPASSAGIAQVNSGSETAAGVECPRSSSRAPRRLGSSRDRRPQPSVAARPTTLARAGAWLNMRPRRCAPFWAAVAAGGRVPRTATLLGLCRCCAA